MKPPRRAREVNDLEKPAFKVRPDLGELKNFLVNAGFGFQAPRRVDRPAGTTASVVLRQ